MKHPRTGGPRAARMEMSDLFASEEGSPLANAFQTKAVHPFIGMSPVAEEEQQATWQKITRQPRSGKSVAYIHIPFCENHCLFCGFYQNPWRDEHGPQYTDAVIDNLRGDREMPYQSEGPIHAVYFGGGTPSALDAKDLARLVTAVRENLPLAPDCEITIEGRVFSFTYDKVKAVFDAGANRISIGVQSFDQKLRQSMARKASRKDVIKFLEHLVLEDRGAIVIDLIYGFPNQSMKMWEDSVRTAIDIGLDGIDLYALALIPTTPLFSAIEKGKFTPTPKMDYGGFYQRGCELMDKARWNTISTTHWRNGTRERNIYNLEVKSGADCLAFGSGAGGFLGGYSYRINGELEPYLSQVENGENPVAHLIKQSKHRNLFNPIKGGMERGRLNLTWLSRELEQRAGLNFETVLVPVIDQWSHAGLVTQSDGWMDLTTAGRFWQVTLTVRLLEWINQTLNDNRPPASTQKVQPIGESA